MYINYELITHQKAPESHLAMHLSAIPLHSALRFLLAVAAEVHNNDNSGVEWQTKVLDCISENNLFAQRVRDCLSQGHVLITPEQLAVLTKFAILYCPDVQVAPGEMLNERLLKVLLLYNSLKGTEAMQVDGTQRQFEIIELRGIFNNERYHISHLKIYEAFFTWSETEQAKKSGSYINIQQDFLALHSMPYDQYVAAFLAIAAFFLTLKGTATALPETVCINLNQYILNLNSQSIVRKWVQANSIDLSSARRAFNEPNAAPYPGASLTPLLSSPLLQVDDDTFACPHIPYLTNKVQSGLYFSMLDAYNDVDKSGAKAERFGHFFAEFLERYYFQSAEEACQSIAVTSPEKIYGPKRSRAKSSDIVIFEDDAAIFIDVTTAKLNLIGSVVNLDEESIRIDIEKIVKKAKQLTRVISDFRSGLLQYDGIDASKIKKIYPLALIIQSFPRVIAINNRIYKDLEDNDYLSDTEQFDILSPEDFHLLLQGVSSGLKISDMLAKKYAHPDDLRRKSSFKNYLIFHDRELCEAVHSKPSIQAAWGKPVLGIIRSWGLTE